MINDRLIVTHSSRGIEFIDMHKGLRLLYVRIHKEQSGAVTFYTPDGRYFVHGLGERPEFPDEESFVWKETKTDVLLALKEVLQIAKEGWPR